MKTIFFDLDGVLATFARDAIAFHGGTIEPYDVEWDFLKQLGVEPAAFWKPLGFEFWRTLGRHEDGFRLLAEAENLVGAENVGLLTSPCDTEGCIDGKRAWVNEHLPGYGKRLFIGSAKHLFAGPGKVLVDDHDKNCEAFSKAGGTPLLVPRPWNKRKIESRRTDGSFIVTRLADELRKVVALA